ncbi:type III secretion system export apparatus subunit SctU [Acidovorax sp. SUPP950]|uniref:type III secretion system export apparatus subunit SctU n=1 Tax=unclassified Acidovorax TaxID=2684926 RepID=UPI0023C8D3CA|nr:MULTISPECIES: type III secretion system export apparatus subunit SctU [Comamonadaceae]WOI44533.1 type III secretion system export apparatus subunit SctU [Paracidovorax avenae]GKS77019.1 type III secretion system export apparatus subunit SctU [Acidovorax sp. SUPP950]GKT00835.1 type III secretion system export apparatus subunit SctU [Acidovorax sp. SUPP3434]
MSEKTEEPTDKKLLDARKKGEVPKSQDVVAAAILVASLLVLIGSGPMLYDHIAKVVKTAMHQGMQAQDTQEVLALISSMVLDGAIAAFSLVIVSVLVAIIAMMGQVGVIISFEAIQPKFEKLNPAEGLKKLINARSIIEFCKSVVKAVALGAVIWQIVLSLVPLLVGSAYLSAQGAGQVAWSAILRLIGFSCLVFVIIGPVDFGLQRWLFMRDQRMSKDDIKRERKDSDGDPHVKGQQRSLRDELANSPPQERVPGATVVVTNPTHYAVALLYEEGVTPLPIVVAKGMDAQAAVIRGLAATHGVPIIANPPLARALHRLPLNQPISEELLESVAVVLRWVAELDQFGGGTAANTSPP